MTLRRLLSCLLPALCWLAFLPGHAWATTYTVTNTNDSGTGSLRAAINSAQSGDTITFASGVSGTITLASRLTISAAITIDGPGAGTLALSGANANGVILIPVPIAVVLSGLTIENGRDSVGGGISSDGMTTLNGCTLANNTASGDGGGIYSDDTLTLNGCTLTGNTTGGFGGGGIFNDSGTLTLTDCLFTANTASNGGGGAGGGLLNEGTAIVTGCTFSGNTANDGGGLYNFGTVTLTDDILFGDTGLAEIGGSVTASHCDINQSGYGTGNGATPDANGNFDADPLFNRENVGYGGSEPYGLQSTSPGIGAGVPVTGLVVDIAGTPRFAPPAIGAYEYVAASVIVTNTNPSGPGSLTDALSSPVNDTVVTFDPGVFATPQTITPSGTLPITNSVAIVGPSAGVAIDGGGASEVFNVIGGGGLSAIGLTLQNGHGYQGGGLYNAGTATLTDCTLTDNSANFGGGIYNIGTAILTNCAFTGNSTFGDGSGIYTIGTATLTNCTFTANSASNGGGAGLENDGGTATLTGCTFTANSGSDRAGGVSNVYGGTMTLTNDILYGDMDPADNEVYLYQASVTASYCDIGEALGSGGDGVTDGGNNMDADPLFAIPYTNSTTPFDLRLQIGSPAIGMGTTGAPDYLPYDITGAARPDPPSLGAYDVNALLPATTTAVTSSANPSIVGQSVTFTATVTPTAGSPTPTGTVKFYLNGSMTAFDTETLGAGGTATSTAQTFTTAGSEGINAVYSGDSGNQTSESANFTQTVNPAPTTVTVTSSANPSTTGQSVTFTATVAPSSGAPTPTGTVNFYLNGSATPFDTETLNAQGQATSSAQTFSAIGSDTVSAIYTGDFNSQTSPPGSVTQTVNGAAIGAGSSLVSSEPNGSTVGQSVTFTATLSPDADGDPTPTGTVTFSVNGGAGISETLDGSGVATYPASALPVGTDTITALYSGDGFYAAPATPLSVTQTVSPVTTTTTTPTASPSAPTTAQTVTLTATVSPSTATGTVTFTLTPTNGSATTETATLSGGTATTAAFTLPAGTYTVTASYAGDTNNSASASSAPLTLTVTTPPPTLLTTFQPGLQMVCLDETYTDFAEALNNGGTPPAYDTYNGANYALANSAAEAAPAPGTGFWIAPGSAVSIYDTGAPATGTVTVPLNQGWNLIGDPFGTPSGFPLADISVGGVSGLANASAQGLLYGTLYTWGPSNTTNYTPVNGLASGASLSPFTGYWLYAFQAGETLTMTEAQ